DVAIADLGDVTGKVWVALGDGMGGFGTPTSFEVSTVSSGDIREPAAVKLGDMDNDGKLDAVTCNSTPTATVNTISILKHPSSIGAPSFSATPTEIPVGKQPFDVLVGQFDGANKLDIIAANRGGNTINVYLSDTAGATLSYATPTTYPAGMGPIALSRDD